MTFQKDQIHALIAEIDSALQKATPRLPWVMSGDATQQRQTLERVRNFLVDLQQGEGAVDPRSSLLAYDIYYQPPQLEPTSPTGAATDMTPQQMLQLFTQELGALRGSLLHPMQVELESLRQQREILKQEVQQLETQHQSYALSSGGNSQQLTAEVVQVLMTRLQETLPYQIAQSLQLLSGSAGASGGLAQGSFAGAMPPYQATERLQAVQAQSDELLINLDTTIRIVFESLQRDMQAYQESLAQGIERMHSLGQQGEMMFSALVTHLAQQIGREASSYLQSAGQRLEESPPTGSTVSLPDVLIQPPQGASPPAPIAAPQIAPPPPPAAIAFPYPGVELAPTEAPPLSMDVAINNWLTTLGEAELASFNLPEVNLDDLDLATVDAGAIDALLNVSAAPAAITYSPEPATSSPEDTTDEDTTDIDAALQLLEQLNTSSTQPADLAEAEAVIDQVLGVENSAPEFTPAPVSAEVDDLYASLFGADPQDAQPEVAEPLLIAEPEIGFLPEPGDIGEVLPDFDPIAGWDVLLEESALASEVKFDSPPADLAEGVLSPVETPPDFDALFDQDLPAEADPLTDADSINLEFAEPLTNVFSVNEPAVDEINVLTDLLDALPLPIDPGLSATVPVSLPEENLVDALPTLAELSESETTASQGSDAYILAAPDENLLPEQQVSEEQGVSLWLDETTLDNLSEDLSNLEAGFANVNPSYFSTQLSEDSAFSTQSEDSAGLTLNDLSESMPQFDTSVLANADSTSAAIAPSASETMPDFEVTLPTPGLELSTGDFIDDFLAAPLVDLPPLQAPESLDDLFGESAAPAQAAAPAFALQGMDDLFADVPVVAATPAPPPIAPTSQPQTAFTLEGMTDLFADVPPVVATPTADLLTAETTPSLAAEPMSFTLEGMDDLFTDLPVPESSGDRPVTVQTDSLEEVSLAEPIDFFADAPAIVEVAEALPVEPTAFTLEQVEGIFTEVTAAAPTTLVTAASSSQPTFAVENRGGVFVEVVTEAAMPEGVMSDSIESEVVMSEGMLPEITRPETTSTIDAAIDGLFGDLPELFDLDSEKKTGLP